MWVQVPPSALQGTALQAVEKDSLQSEFFVIYPGSTSESGEGLMHSKIEGGFANYSLIGANSRKFVDKIAALQDL